MDGASCAMSFLIALITLFKASHVLATSCCSCTHPFLSNGSWDSLSCTGTWNRSGGGCDCNCTGTPYTYSCNPGFFKANSVNGSCSGSSPSTAPGLCCNASATYVFNASSAACLSCAAGRYGASTGNTAASCSGPCSPGYYCPAASTNATQNACPAGTYGASAGLSTASCTALCSAGFYCPAGSTSATQLPCPAGKYNSDPGKGSPNDCSSCNAAKYSREGFTACLPCSIGVLSVNQSGCDPCSAVSASSARR